MSNKLIVLWISIIVILVSTIFVIGKLYEKNSSINETQVLLKKSTNEYLTKFDLWPSVNNSRKVLSSELIKNNYIDEIIINEKVCEATIIVSNTNNKFTYQYDIDCINK